MFQRQLAHSTVLVVALLCACSIAHAQSLNAKPGAWEMTMTMKSVGNVVPPEVVAKMPPEKRAEVERMMASKEGGSRTVTQKSCVKKEDLDSGKFVNRDRGDCKVQMISRTTTKIVAKTVCSGNSEANLTFEAKDPEHVVGVIDQQREGGGKFHIDMVGKWLGASCEGIEPVAKAPPTK